MRLFFIRHGQAEHNRKLVINESNRHISNLTEQGREEVLESAKQLKKTIQFDIIFCSPLVRCQQTAAIINEVYDNKLTIKTDERLSEFKTGFNNRWAIVWAIRLFLSRNRLNKKFKNGQSIIEAAEITKDFCNYLQKHYLQKNVLVVAHLHTFKMFCHYLYDKSLTVPWRKFMYLETSGIHEFKPSHRKESQ